MKTLKKYENGIVALLKKVWHGYKKVVGATRKGGGSRVVFVFYNLSENIWSGFPAFTSLQTGIDSIIRRNLNFLNHRKDKTMYG